MGIYRSTLGTWRNVYKLMRCVLISSTVIDSVSPKPAIDKLWGIGLSACDQRASTPDTWCGINLLRQVLEHARNLLRRETFLLSVTPNSSTLRFIGISLTTLSSILIQPLTFASIPHQIRPMPTRQRSRLSPIRYGRVMPQTYVWSTIYVLLSPSCTNKLPIILAASSPWKMPCSRPYCHSPAESPRPPDSTTAPYWIRDHLKW